MLAWAMNLDFAGGGTVVVSSSTRADYLARVVRNARCWLVLFGYG